jgi:hypothetical protein
MLPLDGAFARKPMWQAMAASFANARGNQPLIRQSLLR